jgi:hypothetical protein
MKKIQTGINNAMQLALRRLESERKKRTFYKIPFELEFLKADLNAWLQPLQRQLDAHDYVPSTASPLDAPKADWHIRPASVITLNDQLAYHYIALICLPNIRHYLEWAEGKIRFSNKILPETENSWFTEMFPGWNQFREKSIELLGSGYNFVLETDISGYYENIDISRLIRELRSLGIDAEHLANLSTCLNKWAEPRGRGIPQGFSPSDLFAEFYLDPLDRHLHSEQFVHLRYMDDIRIFTVTERDARRALHTLTIHLRERGLNLQTAKTKVLPSVEAINSYNKIYQIIEGVAEQLAEELSQLEDVGDPYWGSVEDQIRELVSTNPDSPSIEVLDQIWADFTAGNLGGFDKTLFHFLIKRMSGAVPKDFVISTIIEHPEETEECLTYLRRILPLLDQSTINCVGSILKSPDCLYEYQKYLILKWFFENEIKNSRVIYYARRKIKDTGGNFLCRAYSYAYIGLFAEAHDYETLQHAYINTNDWTERAIIICAMRSAPVAIRNHFYGRIRGENNLTDRAIRWACQ